MCLGPTWYGYRTLSNVLVPCDGVLNKNNAMGYYLVMENAPIHTQLQFLIYLRLEVINVYPYHLIRLS